MPRDCRERVTILQCTSASAAREAKVQWYARASEYRGKTSRYHIDYRLIFWSTMWLHSLSQIPIWNGNCKLSNTTESFLKSVQHVENPPSTVHCAVEFAR
jgi:hypothetical protein